MNLADYNKAVEKAKENKLKPAKKNPGHEPVKTVLAHKSIHEYANDGSHGTHSCNACYSAGKDALKQLDADYEAFMKDLKANTTNKKAKEVKEEAAPVAEETVVAEVKEDVAEETVVAEEVAEESTEEVEEVVAKKTSRKKKIVE